MPLEPTEAYVLSRIDGLTLAHEIVDACGLDTKAVTEALSRMTAMGLIEWNEPAAAGSSEVPPGRPRHPVSGTRIATKRNMAPVQAPTPEVFERFARATHYQLLGLYSDCDREEIRQGYARARNFEEGTLAAWFAARLGEERVLSRVMTAYEVLASPQARSAYDEYLLYREETCAIEDALSEGVRRASLIPSRAPVPTQISTGSVSDENSKVLLYLRAEKLTADYLVAALRAHAPGGARRKRAERLIRDAMAERDGDNLVGATNALRLADSIVPDCEALEGALGAVTQEMNRSLASTFRAQAVYEEHLQMWEAAAETWEKVLSGQPRDARAARGVAQALLEAGGDLERARRRAEQAVKAAPGDALCYHTLARVYIAAGMTKYAQVALNMADHLESQAKERNGILKWVRDRWSRG